MLARLIRVHFKITCITRITRMYNNKIDIRIYNNLLFTFLYILNLQNLTKFKTYKPVQFILNFRIMYHVFNARRWSVRQKHMYMAVHTTSLAK
jgi:hypothetical protein